MPGRNHRSAPLSFSGISTSPCSTLAIAVAFKLEYLNLTRPHPISTCMAEVAPALLSKAAVRAQIDVTEANIDRLASQLQEERRSLA
ncbi:hypothetical protein C8R46DRAFT_1340720, partial [Mycena filopes]